MITQQPIVELTLPDLLRSKVWFETEAQALFSESSTLRFEFDLPAQAWLSQVFPRLFGIISNGVPTGFSGVTIKSAQFGPHSESVIPDYRSLPVIGWTLLQNSVLQGVRFGGVAFRSTVFNSNLLTDVEFVGCRFSHCSFRAMDMRRCRFSHCEFNSGCDFSGALNMRLENCHLRDAAFQTIDGVTLIECDVTTPKLTQLGKTRFERCTIIVTDESRNFSVNTSTLANLFDCSLTVYGRARFLGTIKDTAIRCEHARTTEEANGTLEFLGSQENVHVMFSGVSPEMFLVDSEGRLALPELDPDIQAVLDSYLAKPAESAPDPDLSTAATDLTLDF